MLKISIVVPVYNVEKYLLKCLDSVLMQDISKEDYEIIIVNDGSTDRSLLIANEFATKHNNIKIISQENQGLGGARNTGIQHSTGKYLMFVDSDDYIRENVLESLIRKAVVLNLDVLRFNHHEVDENYNSIPKTKNATHAVVFKDDVVDGETYLTDRMGWACYVCIYLFKRSFLLDHVGFFVPEIYFEDVEWLPKCLLKAKRISATSEIIYYYLQRSGSITKAQNKSKINKLLDDRMLLIQNLLSLKLQFPAPKVKKWADGLIALSVPGTLSFIDQHLPERKKEYLKFINSHKLFPLTMHKMTIKQKMNILLVNISPTLYMFIKRGLK